MPCCSPTLSISTLQRDLPSKHFNKKIVLVTGELSGEIHAAELVKAIRESLVVDFSGIGSARLAEEGVRIIYDYGNISLTGLSEIFVKLRYIREAYATLKRHMRDERPSVVILVDFPGFNLKVARLAKRYGIPVIYFIPPQIWAWRESRIKEIKKYVDKVICILPFEKGLYDRHGMDATYIGHPFTRAVKPKLERAEFLRKVGVEEGDTLVAIMPGSRENEIAKHMPLMEAVVMKLKGRVPNLKALLPVAESIDGLSAKYRGDRVIIPFKGLSHDALAYSDIAIVASGSATLEAALLGIPTIVVYKIASLSYLIAKALVKVKYISLPNIIMEGEIFPEFIQRINAEDIAEKAIYMLKNGREGLKVKIQEMKRRLGSYDSYRLAGESVVEFLKGRYGVIS
jgi:lipid-A-disaccharide synthase